MKDINARMKNKLPNKKNSIKSEIGFSVKSSLNLGKCGHNSITTTMKCETEEDVGLNVTASGAPVKREERERCSGSFRLAVGFLVIKDDSISERPG